MESNAWKGSSKFACEIRKQSDIAACLRDKALCAKKDKSYEKCITDAKIEKRL
jgi:hypothetical protein